MENPTVFTEENVDQLKKTCEKIISLCNESTKGKFMMTQLMFLGDNIKDFKRNPIVKTSGV
jgi:hypothetical protein